MKYLLATVCCLFPLLGYPGEPYSDSSHIQTTSGKRVSLKNISEEKRREFVYLFDVTKQAPILADGPLEKNRIYIRYEPRVKSWVFDLSDASGRFKNPPQFFLKKSIVRGNYLGLGKDKKFLFHGQGPMLNQWIESSGVVEFYMWEAPTNPNDPPKKITFMDPEADILN